MMGAGGLASIYQPGGFRLAQSLAALPRPTMRAHLLSERLCDLSPLMAVWYLEVIIRGALDKQPEFSRAYDGMIWPEAILQPLDPSFIGEMIDCGTDEGCIAAVLWLRSSGVDGKRDKHNDSKRAERLIALPLKDMTLGARRSLARTAQGQQLKLLLGDPDPAVIHNLLNNPRMTRSDVLVICAKRPTLPAPLMTVLRSEKWGGMPWVRLSLARNPHLPVSAGVVLLPCLTEAVLNEIIADATLPAMLRMGAQHLLNTDA